METRLALPSNNRGYEVSTTETILPSPGETMALAFPGTLRTGSRKNHVTKIVKPKNGIAQMCEIHTATSTVTAKDERTKGHPSMQIPPTRFTLWRGSMMGSGSVAVASLALDVRNSSFYKTMNNLLHSVFFMQFLFL